MADPVTLATVGIASSAAGSGVGAIGSLMGGDAKSAMYGYQSGMALIQRKIALQNRDYSLAAGEQEAGNYGLKAGATMGSIVARQGASGVDVNQGSTVDVQKSQQKITNTDLATIRNNAARKAYGYEVEATQDLAQSRLYDYAGSEAKTEGEIGAFSSLLGGASSVSSKWLQAKQYGIYT